LLECLTGAGNGSIDVISGVVWDIAENLAGGGIFNRDHAR
jgi:hypothetical protein